jgi:hypothetical protein
MLAPRKRMYMPNLSLENFSFVFIIGMSTKLKLKKLS